MKRKQPAPHKHTRTFSCEACGDKCELMPTSAAAILHLRHVHNIVPAEGEKHPRGNRSLIMAVDGANFYTNIAPLDIY